MIPLNFKKKYEIRLAKTANQHWYHIALGKKKLGVVPSATTILNAYPQPAHLNKWIGENGWTESQRILNEAGVRGTRVHDALELLLDGETLWEHSYTLDEWRRINAFVEWYKEAQPETIAVEVALYSPKHHYAGRVDYVCRLDGKVTVLDFKTSGSLYPHFPLQFAAYAQAIEETTDIKVEQTAGLQLGTRTKKGWKLEVHENWREHFKVFKTIQDVWKYDNYGVGGKIKDPEIFDLPSNLTL